MVTLMSAIEQFVRELAIPVLPRVFNPWRERCAHDLYPDAPERRRERLAQHLGAPSVRFLAVGEAPGWQGCRASGIPFTSEKLLLNGAIPRIAPMHGKRITDRELPLAEPSATILWTTLYELGIAEETVLWNAFPFHPFDGEPWSNRTPTDSELELGRPYLEAMLALYPDARVIAVGKKAAGSLKKLGIQSFAEVRHPSNGGKPQFVAGLSQAVTNARNNRGGPK